MKVEAETNIVKVLGSILAPTILAFSIGCGGGSGDITQEINDDLLNNPPNIPVVVVNPGIYSGTMTPNGGLEEQAFAVVQASGRTRIVNIDNLDVYVGGYVETAYIGTLYSSSNVISNGQVSSNGANFNGTYTSSLSSGTLNFDPDSALYNQAISLSMLEGTWVDELFTDDTGTTTWVVQSDGTFVMVSTQSCAATGQIDLTSVTKNELSLTMTITNCDAIDGVYTGIGFIGETDVPFDTLVLIFNNTENAGFSIPLRQ